MSLALTSTRATWVLVTCAEQRVHAAVCCALLAAAHASGDWQALTSLTAHCMLSVCFCSHIVRACDTCAVQAMPERQGESRRTATITKLA
jgi:hypothetical protein